jgi:hypothetical protein
MPDYHLAEPYARGFDQIALNRNGSGPCFCSIPIMVDAQPACLRQEWKACSAWQTRYSGSWGGHHLLLFLQHAQKAVTHSVMLLTLDQLIPREHYTCNGVKRIHSVPGVQ